MVFRWFNKEGEGLWVGPIGDYYFVLFFFFFFSHHHLFMFSFEINFEMNRLVIWMIWAGDVSCGEPSDQSGRNIFRTPCSGTVWHRCVCGSGASARRSERSATDIQANGNGTVFHLYGFFDGPSGESSWCTPCCSRGNRSGGFSSSPIPGCCVYYTLLFHSVAIYRFHCCPMRRKICSSAWNMEVEGFYSGEDPDWVIQDRNWVALVEGNFQRS